MEWHQASSHLQLPAHFSVLLKGTCCWRTNYWPESCFWSTKGLHWLFFWEWANLDSINCGRWGRPWGKCWVGAGCEWEKCRDGSYAWVQRVGCKWWKGHKWFSVRRLGINSLSRWKWDRGWISFGLKDELAGYWEDFWFWGSNARHRWERMWGGIVWDRLGLGARFFFGGCRVRRKSAVMWD